MSACALIWLPIACGTHTEDDHHEHSEDNHEHIDEDHHEHAEGSFIIEPERASQLGISAQEIQPSEFAEVIKTGGRIEPSATDMMTATAHTSGIFHLNNGITQGMKVKRGALIGTISSAGMQGGDVNAAAKANLDAAKSELDRLTPLYHEGLVTAAVYNEAQRRYKEALALASPHSGGGSSVTVPEEGTLSQLLAASGQFVDAGTPIAIVTKNTRLTLRADLPERYFQNAAAITTARFRPAYSDSVFSLDQMGGSRLAGSLSSSDSPGYLPVYFTFNGGGEIVPGAAVEIYLIGMPRHDVLSLPREALLELQGNKFIYVVHDGHAYEKRAVKTGNSDGRRVEILSGLEPGETVVVSGATIARMAETSAIAPPGHSHSH